MGKDISITDLFGGEPSEAKAVPKKTKATRKQPEHKDNIIEVPEEATAAKEVTAEAKEAKEITAEVTEAKETPVDTRDTVTVNGITKKIVATKFKYFRNRTASIYDILKVVPLSAFLAYEKGTFDRERDSDQILFDFLVAVFDDEEFVRNNYDDFTAEDMEIILNTFGKVNHIEEKKEQAQKNREAQMKR